MEVFEAFPRRFGFFDLGKVELNRSWWDLSDHCCVILFRFTGDAQGLCAVSFQQLPRHPEKESMAVEIANILVAKFAHQLSETTGDTIGISPPMLLDPTDFKNRNVLKQVSAAVASKTMTKSYQFIGESERIFLYLTYLPGPSGNS